jgi:hypothetical protein
MSDVEPCSLVGAFHRVNRAGEHLREFMRRVEAIRQEQLDVISWDFDPERMGEIKVNRTRMVLIPLQLSILVGEVCYNLRAALDYLVYELAILDSGSAVDGTQFPIEDKPKGFAWRQKGSWLNGINPAHVAAIEALQPYRGCDWTRKLRELSNPDKHRRLHLNQGGFELSVYPHADRLRFLGLPGSITSAIDPITGKEVYVQVDLTLEIQFSDGTPVVETLKEIQTQVAIAVDAFQPDFQ